MIVKHHGQLCKYIGFTDKTDWWLEDDDGNVVEDTWRCIGKQGYNVVICGLYYCAIDEEDIKSFTSNVQFHPVKEAMKMIPRNDRFLFENLEFIGE